MIKIKKLYSEYHVDLNILNFLGIEEFKIRVFEYLIKHSDGRYEAILNVSFKEANNFYIDLNDEIKLEEYYSRFSSFGMTEKYAINNLIELISQPENLYYMKNKEAKIIFWKESYCGDSKKSLFSIWSLHRRIRVKQ